MEAIYIPKEKDLRIASFETPPINPVDIKVKIEKGVSVGLTCITIIMTADSEPIAKKSQLHWDMKYEGLLEKLV